MVEGNYIGTDSSGATDLENGDDGVDIFDASNNTIGGTTGRDRNVISGNAQDGVFIDGSATGNLVAGNYIGTDVTGTNALGNAYSGVQIADSASENTIGGTAAGDRNVISGNAQAGVFIDGSAMGNLVAGNYIGSDVTGSRRLGNSLSGVEIGDSASNNTIGGTAAGDRNVISGNAQDGVYIYGSATATWSRATTSAPTSPVRRPWETRTPASRSTEARRTTRSAGRWPGTATSSPVTPRTGCSSTACATGNLVAGNYIGTDVTGTKALGNAYSGVEIHRDGEQYDWRDHRRHRNVISGNGGDGIYIHGSGTSNNLVEGNYVGVNAGGTAALETPIGALLVDQAPSNTVGGTTATARNVISGNQREG